MRSAGWWPQHIGPLLDRNVIVENRTGGDGLIGIKSVMSAPPDGTTILMTTGPTMYLLPMVETMPSFNHGEDFVPVSLLGALRVRHGRKPGYRRQGLQGAGRAGSRPIRTRRPIGVPSNGTIPHFTGLKLEEALGIR